MKSKRQKIILDLIKSKIIFTQDEIQNELLALGFDVTQSTVSRDIKDLRLVKGHDSGGNYRYIVAESVSAAGQSTNQYRDLFIKSVKTIEYALNNIVIKCYNGMASSACVAVDALFSNLMLGSLAGDDTIIIVTKSEADSQILCDEMNKLL